MAWGRGKLGLWRGACRVQLQKSGSVAFAHEERVSLLFPSFLALIRGSPSPTASFGMVCPPPTLTIFSLPQIYSLRVLGTACGPSTTHTSTSPPHRWIFTSKQHLIVGARRTTPSGPNETRSRAAWCVGHFTPSLPSPDCSRPILSWLCTSPAQHRVENCSQGPLEHVYQIFVLRLGEKRAFRHLQPLDQTQGWVFQSHRPLG